MKPPDDNLTPDGEVIIDDWTGCYSTGWGDLIVPDAYAHPAKYSRALIQRIYQHAREEGWLAPGSTVVDPFGGVALGGFDAAWNGCHFIGVELEPKFVALAEQNIAAWQERYGHLSQWGSVRVVQGDSRRLGEVVREASCVVSSPPFQESMSDKPSKQILAGSGGRMGESCKGDGYGSTPGQLGSLPATDEEFDAAIGSPPFAEQQRGGGLALECDGQKIGRNCGYQNQGETAGQLGAMRDRAGGFDQVVSSPPWEAGAEGALRREKFKDPEAFARKMSAADGKGTRNGTTPESRLAQMNRDAAKIYGDSPGQLGVDKGDDFWTAARTILTQTYLALRPGAHACWVVKAFVRNKRIVDFPDQWRRLCESVGFRTLHLHRAWLVEVNGHQGRLDGGEADRVGVERKSFFRRLAESKGSPRIDYEVVLCMEVPSAR